MSSGGNYKQRGVRVKPTSIASIRELANKLRRLLDIDTLRVDTSKLLETTLFEYGLTFHVDDPCSPSLARDEDACAFPDEGLIVLSQQVYDGLCDDEPRARFTLAHELGHMVMHGSEVQGFARAHDPSKPHKAYCDSEWQADTFSAEFLMPANEARFMSEYQIMEEFGVSAAAARIRASVLRKKN